MQKEYSERFFSSPSVPWGPELQELAQRGGTGTETREGLVWHIPTGNSILAATTSTAQPRGAPWLPHTLLSCSGDQQ